MNSLDIFFLVVLSIFFVRGIFRGFILELTTLIGLVLGYLVSITYASLLSGLVLKFFPTLPAVVVNIVSFSLLFIGTNIGLRIVAGMVTRTLKFAMLGWLNRLLGGLFGLLKSMLIITAVTLGISFIPYSEIFLEKIEAKGSFIYPLFEKLGPQLYTYIQSIISNI